MLLDISLKKLSLPGSLLTEQAKEGLESLSHNLSHSNLPGDPFTYCTLIDGTKGIDIFKGEKRRKSKQSNQSSIRTY